MSAVGCYKCSQKGGHALTDGKHMPFHCKPDLCPDKAKHWREVYAGRITWKHGSITHAGVNTYYYIDGKKADTHYKQERCICGLVLIWTPKEKT